LDERDLNSFMIYKKLKHKNKNYFTEVNYYGKF
jgi:hypothetical protein